MGLFAEVVMQTEGRQRSVGYDATVPIFLGLLFVAGLAVFAYLLHRACKNYPYTTKSQERKEEETEDI
jgi:hypothetical protein